MRTKNSCKLNTNKPILCPFTSNFSNPSLSVSLSSISSSSLFSDSFFLTIFPCSRSATDERSLENAGLSKEIDF